MENPPNEPEYEAKAGKTVMHISVLIILLIVMALVLEVVLVEMKFTKPELQNNLTSYCSPSCTENDFAMAMEQDAQLLRTDRVRTSMISRLMIFVVAEVVALLLVALGGVLIFNRIESTRDSNEVGWKDLVFRTNFPGLIMCGLGAFVIYSTVQMAGGPSLLLRVVDLPVYTKDTNFDRNQLGIVSGQAPANANPSPQFDPSKPVQDPRQ